jgi:hypothetical protein
MITMIVVLCIAVVILTANVIDLRRRLDATQFYHTARLDARICWLEGKYGLSRIRDADADRWAQRK